MYKHNIKLFDVKKYIKYINYYYFLYILCFMLKNIIVIINYYNLFI
jgi:hypothetical protein